MGHDGSIFDSLGVRLLVPVFVTVGAVLSVYALFNFRSTRDHFLAGARADLQRSSGLIQRATHDGMLLNRLDAVQTTIERLAEAPDVAAIRVYDKQGTIVLSARRDELGRRISLDVEPCTSCHSSGDPLSTARLERIRLPPIGRGEEVLRHLTVIHNEPSCAAPGCHSPPDETSVLGVLDVEMSMAPLEDAVSSARRQLVGATVALVLIAGAFTAAFIRNLVQRPIRELYAGTRRIAAGDLQTRIEVRGRHELAQLAAAFNRMAADLGRAQHELRQWSQKLEDKVVEKTEELRRAQRQVLHMEKMASLGKLSATVAHELNNPLSGVLTYARLVERELEEQPIDAQVHAELRRYLGLVQKECSRCGDIVRNLLLFARRRGAEMAAVDVNDVVDRSLMLVRHHLEMKGIRLAVEPLAGSTEMVADAGQLQQALVALFVNAVEAMSAPDREEGELSVRLSADAEEVRIDVGDTGVGIPPEVVPQIFEPFFSTKDAESGAGLGLAVVYGIVRRHGGTIEVESEPGRGTIFHLRLPRRQTAAPEEA